MASDQPSPASAPRADRRLWWLIGLLSVAVAGMMFYKQFRREPSPSMARYVPAEATLFVELPDLRAAAQALAGVRWLRGAETGVQGLVEQLGQELAGSFEVDPGDVAKLPMRLDQVSGFVLEDEDRKHHYTALLLRVDDADAVEALLGSARFDVDGRVLGGRKLKLLSKADSDERKARRKEGKPAAPQRKADKEKAKAKPRGPGIKGALDALALEETESLIWFERDKLLAIGDTLAVRAVGEVVSEGRASLAATSKPFQEATWPVGAALRLFVPPETWLEKIEGWPLTKELLRVESALTYAIRIEKEGLVEQVRLPFAAPERARSWEEWRPDQRVLSTRLPAGTLAYLSIAGSRVLEGQKAEVRDDVMNDLRELGQMSTATVLRRRESDIGINLQTIAVALGREVVVGAMTDASFKPGMLEDDGAAALDHGAVYVVSRPNEERPARELVSLLKQRLRLVRGTGLTIESDDTGFVAVDEKKKRRIVLKLINGRYLVGGYGADPLLRQLEASVRGDEPSLAGTAPHDDALKYTAPSSQLFFWLDSGAALGLASKGSKEAGKLMKAAGIGPESIQLDGDQRISSAASIELARPKGSDEARAMLRMSNMTLPIALLVGSILTAEPPPEDNGYDGEPDRD